MKTEHARRDEQATSVEPWPPLKYGDWADTAQTLHLWMQIVGKIRMETTPSVNHCWHVTLYLTSRGLRTSPMLNGGATFEIELDFIGHRLSITTSGGRVREIELRPMTVASFHEQVMAALAELGVDVTINPKPCEIEEPIPFPLDTKHRSYDADAAARFWRVLVDTSRVLSRFRSSFLGKVSPVHLFWGGMDLAMTRFSGREAPPHPPMPGLPLSVVRDAYSHEVSSAGFWPGGSGFDAAFYAYAYPEPDGFGQAPVRPAEAFYSPDLREYLLPYESVRTSASPDDTLMEFLQSTYEAAANLAGWDRDALERRPTPDDDRSTDRL
jgi:hypothetical protein